MIALMLELAPFSAELRTSASSNVAVIPLVVAFPHFSRRRAKRHHPLASKLVVWAGTQEPCQDPCGSRSPAHSRSIKSRGAAVQHLTSTRSLSRNPRVLVNSGQSRWPCRSWTGCELPILSHFPMRIACLRARNGQEFVARELCEDMKFKKYWRTGRHTRKGKD